MLIRGENEYVQACNEADRLLFLHEIGVDIDWYHLQDLCDAIDFYRDLMGTN